MSKYKGNTPDEWPAENPPAFQAFYPFYMGKIRRFCGKCWNRGQKTAALLLFSSERHFTLAIHKLFQSIFKKISEITKI